MMLELMILLIVIIFTLFSLFMWCYDSEERKKRSRLRTRCPSRSFEDDINVNPSRFRSPNPNNIGFNVTTIDGPSTGFAPVGVAPGAYSAQPSPYPPAGQPPYPVVESREFPRPETTLIRPSAPDQDYSQPPSYYEATKQNKHY